MLFRDLIRWTAGLLKSQKRLLLSLLFKLMDGNKRKTKQFVIEVN